MSRTFDQTLHDAIPQLDLLHQEARQRMSAGESFIVRADDKGYSVSFTTLDQPAKPPEKPPVK